MSVESTTDIRSAEVQGLIYRVESEWRVCCGVTFLVLALPVYWLIGLLGWSTGWQTVASFLAGGLPACGIASLFRGARYYDQQRQAIYRKYEEAPPRS